MDRVNINPRPTVSKQQVVVYFLSSMDFNVLPLDGNILPFSGPHIGKFSNPKQIKIK